MNAWLPEVGECKTVWFQSANKSERDYKASQAHKTKGYIKHSTGDWKHVGQKTVYWLSIYVYP